MREILLSTRKKRKYYKMFSALIDDEDFERVNKYFWSVKHDSYTGYGYVQ